MNTEMLFSINSLPEDQDTLQELRTAINAKLGDTSVDIHEELVKNLEVARQVRDELCGIGSYGGAGLGADYSDEKKDATKIASIRAFTDVIANLIKLQETALSQQGNAALQNAVIDILGELDPDMQLRVIKNFRERIQELEQKARR